MDINWIFLAALASLAVSLIFNVLKISNRTVDQGQRSEERSLSLREHAEYKTGVKDQLDRLQAGQLERLQIREFNDWHLAFVRQIDQIRLAMRDIELKSPTTGELDKMFQNLDGRLVALERRIAASKLQTDDKN